MTYNEPPTPEQIKESRLAIHRTQCQVAALLGVSFAAYSRWENGHSIPQRSRWAKLWKLVEIADKRKPKREVE
jgi:transcriptional regulator with XRE-family HTH domain